MRAVLTTAAVAILLAACSSGDSQASDFCDDLTDAQTQLATLDQTDSAALADAVDRLNAVDPPDDIADSYRAVLDVYTAIVDNDASLTDPALATQFADVRTHIDRIDQYITDTCTDERAPDQG